MAGIFEFPERRRVEQEAADWLIRLDRDTEPSGDELRALREWLSRSPVHRQELVSLSRLWGNMNVLTELAVPARKISRRQRFASLAGRRGPVLRVALAGLAGLLVVGLSSFFFNPDRSHSLAETNGLYTTGVGEQQSIVLADGSMVVLNTNSEIEIIYSERFRNIQLIRGEAHFSVAEDAAYPFRVYAANRRVEAVGTAFSVHLQGRAVRVAVSEGKVALVSHGEVLVDLATSNSATAEESLGTLDAGEVGMLAEVIDPGAESNTVLRRIERVNIDRMLAWREGTLAFSGESLETVVAEISRYTTIDIELSDPALRSIRIGGQIPLGEIDAMLAALEENFGLRVQRQSRDHVMLSVASEQ